MPAGQRAGRWLAGVGGLAVVLVAAAAAAAITGQRTVPTTSLPFTPTPDRPPAVARHHASLPAFEWPVYGYGKTRTRALALADPAALHPPYRRIWAVHGSTLLEFPPVMGAHSLYLLKNDGAVYAIQRKTGHVEWKRTVGALAAASPAYAGGMV